MLSLFSFATAIFDHSRALKHNEPIFSYEYALLSDGGSKIYRGLGYEIFMYNRIMVVRHEKINYKIGSTLTHWFFPFLNETKTEITETQKP